jgi:hypothetical protein
VIFIFLFLLSETIRQYNKKTPLAFSIVRKGRIIPSAVPPFLFHQMFIMESLVNDDNGITGPDWGHSEVVFLLCSAEIFAANRLFLIDISLWKLPIKYSSHQRVTVNYNTKKKLRQGSALDFSEFFATSLLLPICNFFDHSL